MKTVIEYVITLLAVIGVLGLSGLGAYIVGLLTVPGIALLAFFPIFISLTWLSVHLMDR